MENIFTTRELATIIWIAVFIIWSLFHKDLRKSFVSLLQAFFNRKIFIIFLLMILYVKLIVYLLFQVNLWNLSQLKDTIFWFFSTAFVLFTNVNKLNENENYFRKIIIDNFKLVLILEFLINFYTFPLIIELILIPILGFVIIMNTYAGTKKEYEIVKRLSNNILSIWGIFLIIYIVLNAISSYQDLLVFGNFQAFLLPLLLTIAFLPFLYVLALFMIYESIFTRFNVSIGNRDKDLLRVTKRKIFSTFGINLSLLNKFLKEDVGKLSGLRNESELKEIINRFMDKQIYRNKKF